MHARKPELVGLSYPHALPTCASVFNFLHRIRQYKIRAKTLGDSVSVIVIFILGEGVAWKAAACLLGNANRHRAATDRSVQSARGTVET